MFPILKKLWNWNVLVGVKFWLWEKSNATDLITYQVKLLPFSSNNTICKTARGFLVYDLELTQRSLFTLKVLARASEEQPP